MDCATTEAAVDILHDAGILDKVIKRVICRTEYYLNRKISGLAEIGIVLFSNEYGLLGMNRKAEDILDGLYCRSGSGKP